MRSFRQFGFLQVTQGSLTPTRALICPFTPRTGANGTRKRARVDGVRDDAPKLFKFIQLYRYPLPVESPKPRRCTVYSSFRSLKPSENQPMPDDITEKVLDLIASTKRIPREQVSANSTFAELGLDSLDAINLIFEIESTFNISVPDAVANSMTSIPQVVEELRKILAPTSQQPPPE